MKVDYRRCDRCHELYDEKTQLPFIYNNLEVRLGYERILPNTDIILRSTHFDLCPECAKELFIFLKIKEEDLEC